MEEDRRGERSDREERKREEGRKKERKIDREGVCVGGACS